jgi:acetyl esterase/lipase
MRYHACRPYLKMGFMVVNVEYRLGSIAPAAEDAVRALRWFSSVAQTYGADPRRIVVTGESAGAHLALFAGFQSGVPVAAIVNFYGLNNLKPFLNSPEFREVLPGGDPESLARQLSPLTYVRRGLPPVFSVHGTADESVPPDQTVVLTESIQAAAGDASALFIKGGTHLFSTAQQDVAFDGILAFLRAHGVVDR